MYFVAPLVELSVEPVFEPLAALLVELVFAPQLFVQPHVLAALLVALVFALPAALSTVPLFVLERVPVPVFEPLAALLVALDVAPQLFVQLHEPVEP